MHVKRVAPHCSSAAIISLIYVPGAGHGARRLFDVACTDPPFAYAGEPADERVTIDFRRGDTCIAVDMHDFDVGEMGYGMLLAEHPHNARGDIRINVAIVSAADPNLSSFTVNDDASIGVWVGIPRSLKLFFRSIVKR